MIVLGLYAICFVSCKKDESDPLETLTADLSTDTWYISKLTVDNNDITDQFENFSLIFTLEKDIESPQKIFNKLLLGNGSDSYRGTWIFTAAGPEEDYNNFLSIAFVNNSEFQFISARWGIHSHTVGKVELMKPAGDSDSDIRVMVLEKQ